MQGPDVAALPGPAETVVRTPRLLASWQRSHRLGVSADVVEPAFGGAFDADSLLNQCRNQVARAAAELGVSRATAYRKISQYGTQLPERGGA